MLLSAPGIRNRPRAVAAPSIGSVWPLTKLDIGEARYSTEAATSSGAPGRPSGMLSECLTSAAWAASPSRAWVTGVRIGPQDSTFIRTPRRPYSAATVCARLDRAALDAP